jgi:hypothetical protein
MRQIASTFETRRFLLPAVLITLAIAGYVSTRPAARTARVVIECSLSIPVDQARALPPSDPVLECRRYLVELDRVTRCERFPGQSRDTVDAALTRAAQAWRDLPPDAMRRLAQACRSGLEALAQTRDSLCGSQHRDQDRGRDRDREQQAQQ